MNEYLLQILCVSLILGSEEAMGHAEIASAACPANAMNVVLDLHREIKIYHVVDILDVQPSGGNISRHH